VRQDVRVAWLFLAGAILAEITATLALRGTAVAPRPLPILVVIVGYTVSFVLMMYALKRLNVGIVYAIWSGVGTAGVAVVAALLYRERLSVIAIGGMVLIIVGVVMLVTSGTTTHA
jgi:small multidrug resistance pump